MFAMMRGLSGSSAVCPWCGAPGQSADASAGAECQRCGRSPAQHPSREGGGGGLTLDLGDRPSGKDEPFAKRPSGQGLAARSERPSPFAKRPARRSSRIPSKSNTERITEGPKGQPVADPEQRDGEGLAVGMSIELDTPKATGARGEPATEHNAPEPRSGLGLFDDDDDGESLDIGLDLGSRPPPASEPAPAGPGPPSGAEAPVSLSQPSPSRPSGGGGASQPLPEMLPVAGPATPAAPPPAVDPERVRVLADYGPFPPNIAATPIYTLGVLKRRLELKKLHRQQQRLHDDTRRTLREELADEVTKMVAASSGGTLDDVKRTLAEADAVVSERQQVMDSASSAFAARFKAVDDELARQKEARKAAVEARDMALIRVEDAQQKQTQADEERKRVEGRLAAAHEAAREAADAGAEFAPPEHAQQIAELQAQAVSVAKSLAEQDKVLAEARRQLRERERAIKQVDATIAGVHRQQASLEREASQTHGAAIEALKQAQLYRLDLYDRVLNRIRTQHADLVDTDAERRLAAVKERIKEADVDLEAHRLALEAYDEEGFKRGVAILAVIGLIILLVLGTFVRIALA